MGGSEKFARRASAVVVAWMSSAAAADPLASWHHDATGRVQVDVRYDCTLNAPPAALSAAGLSVSSAVKIAPLCAVEGWIAPDALALLTTIPGVTAVKQPRYAVPIHPRSLTPSSVGAPQSPLSRGPAQKAQTAGAIDGHGVSIMRADTFVSQTGTNGAGVTVGVQSTGVSYLTTIQGRGELPSVQVVLPGGQTSPAVGDEGTALLQEIHAVAPGAGLAFCGPTTFVEYTSCLGQLVGAGATILVDDIIFPGEDDVMSTDSTDAEAVQQFLSQHPSVMMFTSAGNYTNSYWEGSYAPIGASSPLSCTYGSTTQVDNYYVQFTLQNQGGLFPMLLAWADPPGQNASNFDLYWYSGSTQLGCASAAGSTDSAIYLPAFTSPIGASTLYVATPDASLANKFIKLWAGGDGLSSLVPSSIGSIVSPQAFAPGVITIGAVNGSDGIGNTIESFSSQGPLSVAFPSPAQIQAPFLVAPDGIYVDAAGTYFQGAIFPDGNFYGTSAAVPNAGAVAALLRGAFSGLSPADVLRAMRDGAAQVGPAVPDGTYGYGRVDAMGALGTLPAPTITSLPDSELDPGKSSVAYPFTVTGTGPLHFGVSSSNERLIPAQVVAAGSAGVTVAPPDCGTTTLTCTMSITASTAGGGTVSLKFSALDGANRAAPATMTVTISGPPPPAVEPMTPTVTVNSGSGGGGGTVRWWELLCLALLASARWAPPRRPRPS